MPSVFLLPDGTYTPYPPTPEGAREIKRLRYDNGEKCPECEICSIRFTKNGNCVHCSRLRAIDYYNETDLPRTLEEVSASGSEFYVTWDMCKKAGHVGKRHTGGRCVACVEDAYNPRAEARKNGERWYTPKEDCDKCGTRSPRQVNTNACKACDEASGKRQNKRDPSRAAARREGAKWYDPTDPCDKCGTHSPRNTQFDTCSGCDDTGNKRDPARAEARRRGDNWFTPTRPCEDCGTLSLRNTNLNTCRGCRGTGSDLGVATASIVLMRDNPEMIIDRDTAAELGFKVYRTGDYCRRGHAGWRYLSSGTCLECSK